MPNKDELFQFIENKNLTGIQAGLSILRQESEIRELDYAKDNRGRTLLHAALDSGEINIIYEILAKDVKLEEKNKQGETVLQIAEKRNLTELAALLRSRQEWQRELPPPFRFNMVIDLIKKSFPSISPGKGKDKVLFVGATGSGKSTLLNYLNGTIYESYDDVGISNVRPIGGVQEIAKRGEDIYNSETLYPQVIQKVGLDDFVYCDLAGLFDTHGENHQIVAASSTHTLLQTEGKVKGIMVLLDIPGFLSEKGKSFKKTAAALADIIKNNNSLMQSICFVITKVPPRADLAPQIIKKKYIAPLLKQLTGSLEDEEMKLKFILENIGEDQILIPNICDQGNSRTIIENKLRGLQRHFSTEFDFLSHDNSQECFNHVLLVIAQGYLKRKNQLTIDLPNKISEIKKSQEEENNKIIKWEKEISNIDLELSMSFDPNKIAAFIEDKKKSLSAHKKAIENQETENAKRESKLIDLNKKLGKLDNDDMVLLEPAQKKHFADMEGDGPTRYVMKYKSPYPLDRIEDRYYGWGDIRSDQIKPPMTGRQEIDPRDGKLVNIYVDNEDARQGNYEAVFQASKGLEKVEVTFSAKRRDMHISEISILKEQIRNIEDSKNQSLKEISRLKEEIQRLDKDISDDKEAISKGAADFEIRKHNLLINRRDILKLVEESKTRRDFFIKDLDKYNKAIESVRLEIEVNQKVFEIVYEITHILKLENYHLDIRKFWNSFQNQQDVPTISIFQSDNDRTNTPRSRKRVKKWQRLTNVI